MLKEFYTEEPFYPDGVDIPCCIGDYMDPRGNDESTFDVNENTVEGFHYIPFEQVVLLKIWQADLRH